ncbi:MAG: patatin-like phospholipase family protein [Candidatus Omnitrophica bacterium]|nr:patatin-like phospholipase family protein [Candidatus Omnitrophota bacterium]MCM8826095.1 patatin-like phospholipase family protein [Candidatus Omnitrophota bacterium]
MPLRFEEVNIWFYPFSKLKKNERKKLIRIVEIAEYKKGEIIYKEGAPPDYFYLLLKGRVRITSKYEDGRDKEIEIIKKGTPFGMISVFTDEPHSVTTTACDDSLVLKIEKNRFKSFLKKSPQLALDFSQILSKRVKKSINSPKKIFRSLSIGIFSIDNFYSVFDYTRQLSRALLNETSKRIIVVELAKKNDFLLPKELNKKIKYTSLNTDLSEDKLLSFMFEEEGICYLLLNIEEYLNDTFSNIADFLSENYHFILFLINFPLSNDFIRLLDIVNQLHIIIVNADKEKLEPLFTYMSPGLKFSTDKVKLIIDEQINYKDSVNFNLQFVYGTLPKDKDAYLMFMRRIARDLGEKRLGLVLGSGGAYGFVHIGVLEILEEYGIPIDMVCGSSMGSFIASLWALGYNTKEIKEIVEMFCKKIIFLPILGLSLPRRGLFKAKKLEIILHSIFGDRTFYDLKHSLKIVAFNFLTRKETIIQEGYIYKAVAASCAMPGIFEPIIFKGDILLDGGVLSPLPTEVMVNHNINKIIAVNVTPSPSEINRIYNRERFNILDFIFGSIESMQQEFVKKAQDIADIVIHPNLESLTWTEFNKLPQFIERGKKATLERIADIIKLVND